MNRLLNHQPLPFQPDEYNTLKLKQQKTQLLHYKTDQVQNRLTRVFYPVSNQSLMVVIDQYAPRLLTTNHPKILWSIIILFILIIGLIVFTYRQLLKIN